MNRLSFLLRPKTWPFSFLLRPETWPFVALSLSVAALLIAYGSEVFGGLTPCVLCLRQREILFMTLPVVIGGWALIRWTAAPSDKIHLFVCILLAVLFAVGSLVAAYHAGVEWGVFPPPATCSTGSAARFDDLLERLEHPIKILSCADAPFRFAGLSMAGWNALFCAALALTSLRVIFSPPKTETA